VKKLTLTVLLVVTVSLLFTGCNSSATGEDDSWNKVKEKGEFVMGLDDNFPPMGYRDEKGEIIGFDIDVAKEVSSRLGVELIVQPINWDTKEKELNTGKIDCIWNGFTIKEDRKKNVLFSEPYMRNKQVLVVTDKSGYSKLSDLEGKKLGLQAGSSAADALEEAADFKAKLKDVIEFDENITALMDLEKGGVDVVLVDEIVARYYIQSEDKGYTILDETLAEEEYGIGFRLKDTKLRNKVQETLESMAKDGKLAEISNEWFDKDITTVKK
jgi:polar amino acid transport system substrate-binding protein